MSFSDIFKVYNWADISKDIRSKTTADVLAALDPKKNKNLEDFKALISPAASEYLEDMAQLSHRLTLERFGKTIQLYAPLYLSNECTNICTYCGFSVDNKLKRKTLSDNEIIEEAKAVKAMGYEHILLVTGESQKTVGVEYIKNAIKLIRPLFSHISIEVQPLEENEYNELAKLGLNTVLLYQETYNQNNYKTYHPKGKKSNFEYRINAPDRIGKANIHKIGIGTLIGLEDWRTEAFYTAKHLSYLEKKYWKTKYSISFPRLRPAEDVIAPRFSMSDKELVQLICAYRIFNQEVELSISTRESEQFRNNIIKLGTTTMSAGSKTNPGGYVVDKQTLEQFEISDDRSPREIEKVIKEQGYEAVWKDWDKALMH